MEVEWEWKGNVCVCRGGDELSIVLQNCHSVCDVAMFLHVVYVEGLFVFI